MNWLDFVIVAIILLSAGISLIRGFVKEALSLTTWLAALWVSMTFAYRLDALLLDSIDSPSIRFITSFSALFLLTLIAGALLNHLASTLVKKTGLSGTDRMFGVIFGAARGIAIVAVIVMGAGMTSLPQESGWDSSMLIPKFQEMAIWLRSYLPPDIASNIKF